MGREGDTKWLALALLLHCMGGCGDGHLAAGQLEQLLFPGGLFVRFFQMESVKTV